MLPLTSVQLMSEATVTDLILHLVLLEDESLTEAVVSAATDWLPQQLPRKCIVFFSGSVQTDRFVNGVWHGVPTGHQRSAF